MRTLRILTLVALVAGSASVSADVERRTLNDGIGGNRNRDGTPLSTCSLRSVVVEHGILNHNAALDTEVNRSAWRGCSSRRISADVRILESQRAERTGDDCTVYNRAAG